jgi:hypothetical protein
MSETLEWCRNELEYLPDLYFRYFVRLPYWWKMEVRIAGTHRAHFSKTPAYLAWGPEYHFSPWRNVDPPTRRFQAKTALETVTEVEE